MSVTCVGAICLPQNLLAGLESPINTRLCYLELFFVCLFLFFFFWWERVRAEEASGIIQWAGRLQIFSQMHVHKGHLKPREDFRGRTGPIDLISSFGPHQNREARETKEKRPRRVRGDEGEETEASELPLPC